MLQFIFKHQILIIYLMIILENWKTNCCKNWCYCWWKNITVCSILLRILDTFLTIEHNKWAWFTWFQEWTVSLFLTQFHEKAVQFMRSRQSRTYIATQEIAEMANISQNLSRTKQCSNCYNLYRDVIFCTGLRYLNTSQVKNSYTIYKLECLIQYFVVFDYLLYYWGSLCCSLFLSDSHGSYTMDPNQPAASVSHHHLRIWLVL